jgi:hypothetical protein
MTVFISKEFHKDQARLVVRFQHDKNLMQKFNKFLIANGARH